MGDKLEDNKSVFDTYQNYSVEDKMSFLTKVRQENGGTINEITDDIQKLKRDHEINLKGNWSAQELDAIKGTHKRELDALEKELSGYRSMDARIAKDPFKAMKDKDVESLFESHMFEPENTTANSNPSQEPKKSKPNVSETKVENTQQEYHQQSESHNTQTKTPPPESPHSTPPSPNNPQGPHASPTYYDTKKVSSFLRNNRGKIFMGAIGAGVTSSMFDNDDDNLLSSAGKGLKTGLYATGASIAGEALFKSQTVQDLVNSEVNSSNKVKVDPAERKQKLNKIGAKGIGSLKYGAMAIGAAALLDVGQRLFDNHSAHVMENEQEKKLKEKQKRQREKNNKQSYGYLDQGDIVLEMFEARTGHYKMGNARYQ